jgi:hypothetical protein
MGGSPKAEISVYRSELELFSMKTPGDASISAGITRPAPRPTGFFAEFLATAGLYESWVSG